MSALLSFATSRAYEEDCRISTCCYMYGLFGSTRKPVKPCDTN